MSQFWKDWLERVLWTLAQAALAVLAVAVTDLPYWWVAILTPLLSALKGFVAKKVGDGNTASLGGDSR